MFRKIATSLVTCAMKLLHSQGARCSSTDRNLLDNEKRSNGLAPPAPPGDSGRSSVIPARASSAAPEGLGTTRFSHALELKKRRSARCPRVAALVQLHPPPQNHRPGQLAAHTALGISPGAGWWVTGDRGHRKGQLRVLGSPSALRTKGPMAREAPGGRGGRGPDFFWRKLLDTHRRALKPACG
jgi:hypothetical protein